MRLTGSPDAVLESRAATFAGAAYGNGGSVAIHGVAWSTVCLSPCDKVVPPGEYRIGGSSVAPSSTFSITAPSKVDVTTGSRAGATIGLTLAGAGAGVALGAGLLMLLSSSNSTYDHGSSKSLETTMFIGGCVAMAIGIPVWLTNRTKVTVSPDVSARGLRVSGALF